jgi:hypothetical protein
LWRWGATDRLVSVTQELIYGIASQGVLGEAWEKGEPSRVTYIAFPLLGCQLRVIWQSLTVKKLHHWLSF